MKKNNALFRMICAILLAVFFMQALSPAVYAETAAEEKEDDYAFSSKRGTLEKNGLTMIEYTADSYLNSDYLSFMKPISSWPSEMLLVGAAKTKLKEWITVDKIAHLPTNPSQWLDSDKKKKDAYTTILLGLLLEEDEMYDDSDYKPFTQYLSSDKDLFKSLAEWIDSGKELSELGSKEKEELKGKVVDYLLEDADINWPMADVVDVVFDSVIKVEDAVELWGNFKALYEHGERYKAVVEEMKSRTDDLVLFAALDEISNAIDSLPSAFGQLVMDGVIDIGLWSAKKVVNEVFENTVMSLLPTKIQLMIKIGTATGDAVVSFLFANDDMEEALHKLECIGVLGRNLMETTDALGKKYESDKKNKHQTTGEQRQEDAYAYVKSVDVLFDLYLIGCDYSRDFAKYSMDETWFEKLIIKFGTKRKKEYTDALNELVSYKKTALKQEVQMKVNVLYNLRDEYPDSYESDLIDDMHVAEYIDKLYDDYDELIEKVAEDYSSDTVRLKTSSGSEYDGKKVDPEKLMDDFMYNDGPAYDKQGEAFYLKDVQDESKHPLYAVGPRIDIDNDGENELFLVGMSYDTYGGMFLDAKDGKLTVFEMGQGTAGVLGYGYYEGKWVVCHKDTSHAGRNIYSFKVYKGADKIEDSFSLEALFPETVDGYDDGSVFTFKGETITRKEYESLLREIFSAGDPSYATTRYLPKARQDQNAVEESSYISFADVVKQYENEYGKLEFKTSGSGSAEYKYYTGVFLLKNLDFDRDGKYELIIGYATELPEAHISAPKLDVWRMKNGVPVQVYEGACIHHGDVSSRCEFLDYTSSLPELVIGSDGFEIDLSFLVLDNGEFSVIENLKYEFTGTDYQWSIDDKIVTESQGMNHYESIKDNKNKYTGTINKDAGQTEKSIREDLEAAYKTLGM